MLVSARSSENVYAANTQSAFTMVELLLVITIIVVTTAAIIPSFTSYIRNQNVKQGIEQLKSDLRNIQNKALTGSLSDQTISGSPVLYWGVRFTPGAAPATGSGTYEYFISANTTCPNGAIPAAQLQGSSSLSTDLHVKTNANRCMFFSIASGGITTSPAFTEAIVGYRTSTASGDCRRVTFNANGLIFISTSLACT
jgi:type II secretory pathway pseudopilin PulG